MDDRQPLMEATILVIDDEPQWKELLEKAFPQYRFIGALSGSEGLEILAAPNDVDLIILDYKMKLMNGLDVLKRIKEKDPQRQVIMLTAHGSKDIVVESLECRADHFVDKPFEIKDMREKIRAALEKNFSQEKNLKTDSVSIQRVVRFIERNHGRELTLDDAAMVASLSPKYLSRLFKEKTSQSFTDFKISIKMNKAKELLENTSLTVAQIADQLGYQTAEPFEKMFKKWEGCTPTEYRCQKSSL
jgi:YesN/AraC family two-component response regulator